MIKLVAAILLAVPIQARYMRTRKRNAAIPWALRLTERAAQTKSNRHRVRRIVGISEMESSTVFVHPTAVVDTGARVGAYSSIWHFSHLEGDAVVGENCNLGQNTYIGNRAVVGNGCRLGNSVSVFSHVELEDFVFCAPFMVFTHIAFPRAAVNRRHVFDRTRVRTGATLGANSTVVPGITVGVGTFLAAGAVLTKTSKDWSLMIGAPARHVGWVSAFGDRVDLPLSGSGEWQCPHTGDVYVLNGADLSRRAGPVDMLQYVPGKKLERLQVSGS